MENVLMSLFYDQKKGIFAVEPKEVINLQRLIQIYKSDFVKLKTSEIQNPDLTHEEKQILKKHLPFVTPYSCSTYRNKESVYHLNSNIFCLDFDDLIIKDAKLLKHLLTQNESTILTAISPRGKGVKAIIYLPQIKDIGTEKLRENNTHLTELINRFDLHQDKATTQQIENHYYFQKENINRVLNALNVARFKPDISQLKVVQPFLIAYDEYLYYNLNAKPLDVELLQYVPIEREPYKFNIESVIQKSEEQKPIKTRFETKDFNEVIKKRIAGILRKKADFICSDMLKSSNRHKHICRCIDVLEYLHYLPEIESEIVQTLTNGITQMYGSETEAKKSNAYKSFYALKLIDQECEIIEEIIKEEIENQRIETERIANSSKTYAI